MVTRLLSSKRPIIIFLLAVGLLIAGFVGVGRWYQSKLLQERRSELSVELALRGNALSSAINRRLALVDGLGAFVQLNHDAPGFDQQFAEFSQELYYSAPGIRNIAVAPGGIVRYIYPIEGNEKALGYEPIKDPRDQVRADVRQAIDSQEIVITGPIDLVQGGQGLIARKPVFVEEEYWGLVNLVLDFPPILSRAGFDSSDRELELALIDQDGLLIYGSDLSALQDPVVHTVSLPGEDWYIASIPKGGWRYAIRDDLLLYYGVGLLFVLLLASVFFIVLNQQARLAQAVRLKTKEILAVNEQLTEDIDRRRRAEANLLEQRAQYRSIFESVQDGIFIHTLDGSLVAFNPAAHLMLGYSEEEFALLHPNQYIQPEYYPLFEEYIEAAGRGEQYHCQGIAVKKDGTPINYEVFGAPFVFQGERHAMSVVRDITERIQAYQLLETRVDERTHALYSLLQVSQDLVSTLHLEPLLNLILEQLYQIVDYTGAAVFTHKNGVLSARAYRGPLQKDQILDLRIEITASVIDWEIYQQREAVIISDVLGEEPLARAFRRGHKLMPDTDIPAIRSWMGVPLIVKGEYIGTLTIDHSQAGYFQPHHARLVQAFANHAAIAIDNARLYEQARELASLEERQKLARGLHDSISQALFGIILGVRTARSLVDTHTLDQDQAARIFESLEYTESLAETGLAEMRALIFELRPESLEKEGLTGALTRTAAVFRNQHHLDVSVEAVREPDLPLEIKQNLYRIAHEALQNTLKHARASRVMVRLSRQDLWYELTIEDNGIGFNLNDPVPGHIGLISMRERAELSEGTFLLDSSPGKGTRISVRVPHQEAVQEAVFQKI